MTKIIFGMLTILILNGCVSAAHVGKITRAGGLEASCAGACSEFETDGSGCAKFNDDTSKSCAVYFETLCQSTPTQCSN